MWPGCARRGSGWTYGIGSLKAAPMRGINQGKTKAPFAWRPLLLG